MEDDTSFEKLAFEEDYFVDAETRALARCARKAKVHEESNVVLNGLRPILKSSSPSKLPQDLDTGSIQEGYQVPTKPVNVGFSPLLLDSVGYPVRG